MIKYDKCFCCGSRNMDRLKVNSILRLNYPEEKNGHNVSQRVISPTDALVCNECGRVELFVDWGKMRK